MTNVRDGFLSECCRKKTDVTIFTTNGFQLKGVVVAFDGTVLVLNQKDGKQAMVYMTAISTIVPATPALTRFQIRDCE